MFSPFGRFFFFFSATTFDCVRLLPAHTYLYFVYGFLLRLFYFIYLKKEKKKLAALQGCSRSCDPAAAAARFSPEKNPQKPKKPLKFISHVHVVKSPEKTDSK